MVKKPAPKNAPISDFQQAAKEFALDFDEARQEGRRIESGFSVPEIPNGDYLVEITSITCGGTDRSRDPEGKSYPYARFDCVIKDDSGYAGVQVSDYKVVKQGPKQTPKQAWGQLLNKFYGCGFDIPKGVTLADLEGYAKWATENHPLVAANIKITERNGDRYLNMNFLGAVEDEQQEEETEEVSYEQEEEQPRPSSPKNRVKR